MAGVTTTASLMIYRSSGDIYLDRSRPGYLPDSEEVTEESAGPINYTFSENGELNASELDEYLKELRLVNNRLKDFADPFLLHRFLMSHWGYQVSYKEHQVWKVSAVITSNWTCYSGYRSLPSAALRGACTILVAADS